MSTFRQFVEANARWFRGHSAESESALDAAENVLGVRLPPDVRWLLHDFGYWHATGIASLNETITKTLEARGRLHLPTRFLVLCDRGKNGVVLLDTVAGAVTGDHKVYTCDWKFIPDRIEDANSFHSFLAYVRDEMTRTREVIAPKDFDYDRLRHGKTQETKAEPKGHWKGVGKWFVGYCLVGLVSFGIKAYREKAKVQAELIQADQELREAVRHGKAGQALQMLYPEEHQKYLNDQRRQNAKATDSKIRTQRESPGDVDLTGPGKPGAIPQKP